MMRIYGAALALLCAMATPALSQSIDQLVAVSPNNESATQPTTWSIAGYITDRNPSPLIQSMGSQPRPDLWREMDFDELMATLGGDPATRSVVAPAVAPPAATSPATRATSPPITSRTTVRDRGEGGGGGGSGGGGGGGWN